MPKLFITKHFHEKIVIFRGKLVKIATTHINSNDLWTTKIERYV
jgi:hypothetical protein